MIQVGMPQPPPNFNADVAAPGQAFLALHPHPTKPLWQAHRYWSRVHTYLHTQLKGVCSYCASYTPKNSGRGGFQSSIDHYVPKSHGNHSQAYQWDNFRLCRARLNKLKGNFTDVLDPYAIQNGWFQIDFVTFHIEPDPLLPLQLQKQIRDTIKRLSLNSDHAYVNERTRAVYAYADNQIVINDLVRLYPFIAVEMQRQNFANMHLPRFRAALKSPRSRVALQAQGLL